MTKFCEYSVFRMAQQLAENFSVCELWGNLVRVKSTARGVRKRLSNPITSLDWCVKLKSALKRRCGTRPEALVSPMGFLRFSSFFPPRTLLFSIPLFSTPAYFSSTSATQPCITNLTSLPSLSAPHPTANNNLTHQSGSLIMPSWSAAHIGMSPSI